MYCSLFPSPKLNAFTSADVQYSFVCLESLQSIDAKRWINSWNILNLRRIKWNFYEKNYIRTKKRLWKQNHCPFVWKIVFVLLNFWKKEKKNNNVSYADRKKYSHQIIAIMRIWFQYFFFFTTSLSPPFSLSLCIWCSLFLQYYFVRWCPNIETLPLLLCPLFTTVGAFFSAVDFWLKLFWTRHSMI